MFVCLFIVLMLLFRKMKENTVEPLVSDYRAKKLRFWRKLSGFPRCWDWGNVLLVLNCIVVGCLSEVVACGGK